MLTPSTLPGPLRLRPSFPFVGRPRELARAARAAAAGRRRRPPDRAGRRRGRDRARAAWCASSPARRPPTACCVLYGACDAAVRTPYRPFVEALDRLVRTTDPDDAARRPRQRAAASWRGCCRTCPRGRRPARPVEADPDTERHRLHTAVADLLAAASRRRPLLLVLEDCHWADAPTLLPAAPPGPRRGRRADAGGGDVPRHRGRRARPSSRTTLADLRRSEDVVRLHLAGLTADGGRRVRAPRGGAADAPAAPTLAAGDRRPHRGQRVPDVRAVARAGRDRRAVEVGDGSRA